MSKKNLRPGQTFKMRTVDELLGVINEESALDIEIAKIRPFKDHPFKVTDDQKMQDLIESIRVNGILSPVILRTVGIDRYEMISGHRRMHAAQQLGMDSIPAIVREMTDDEAVVMMVDSNIQREELLPSEKAFAYKMKMDAMKRQGARSDLTSGQNGPKLAVEVISEETSDSSRQIKRYIRLTELIPELLDFVDQKKIQFTVAVEISYIDKEIQKWLYEYIKHNGQVKLNQIEALRVQLQQGAITESRMIALLNDTQPGRHPKGEVRFTEKRLRDFFPPGYTVSQMREVIEDLLADWKMNNEEG